MMRWADPDKMIGCFPQGACACGRDIGDAEDLGVAASAQQLDVPEPRAERIQHDMHAARCACGREYIASNNISEGGIRPNKTQQKISGRLTGADTQGRLDIRSYIDTARKHGQQVLTVLRMLMTGRPWMPPAPSLA